jgi:acyl-CoA synthetase (NDP forming)
MVIAVMVIPYAVVRQFRFVGFTVKEWFGDISAVRSQCPDKPLLGVVVGHPEFVNEMNFLCGPSVPVFTSPESAARAMAALWHYSRGFQ